MSAHHVDCDGFRLAHRTTPVPDRVRRLLIVGCEECAWHSVTVSLPPKDGDYHREVARLRSGHPETREVECDGRCASWGDA